MDVYEEGVDLGVARAPPHEDAPKSPGLADRGGLVSLEAVEPLGDLDRLGLGERLQPGALVLGCHPARGTDGVAERDEPLRRRPLDEVERRPDESDEAADPGGSELYTLGDEGGERGEAERSEVHALHLGQHHGQPQRQRRLLTGELLERSDQRPRQRRRRALEAIQGGVQHGPGTEQWEGGFGCVPDHVSI